jgi:beta-N-acetylhexosaminidase
MSKALNKAVGRLLSTRLPGQKLESDARKGLEDGIIGGIVIYKENAARLPQTFKLVDEIRSASPHPLILSVDQEGGAVQRFEHFLTPLPSAMALAASGKIDNVKAVYSINANQIRLLGLNCLLCPVLDVLQNAFNPMVGTRAFSSDPNLAADFGLAAIKAIHRANVVPVGKHFPGYGSVLEDAHTDLAVNDSDATTIWQTDLAPFRTCLKRLPAVMVGHVWLGCVDQDPLPASLSTRVIRGILREYPDLSYDGLVMTDDLVMQAVSDKWSLEEAAVMALAAGADHLLLGCSVDQVLSVHKTIIKSVESGKLTEEQILASLQRIEKLFGVKKKSVTDEDKEKRLEALHQSIAECRDLVLAASMEAATLLRGDVPAITSGEWLVIAPNHARYPLKLAHHLNEMVAHMNKKNTKKFKGLRFAEMRYSVDPSPEEADELSKDCAERNCIFLTFRSLSNQGQIKLGELIHANAREHLHIACDIPYDLVGLPDWSNCMAIFDPSELSMEATASIILGEAKPGGTCPVDLNLELSSAD